MKILLTIMSLLSISFTSYAGYWRCENKSAVVSLNHGYEGIVLVATKMNEPAPFFKGQVEIENLVFDKKGKALSNVTAAFANDSFNANEAVLDIKKGQFHIDDVETGKRKLTFINLKCTLSEGE